MSDISPRSRKTGSLRSLLLIAVLLPLVSGCLVGEKRRTFSPPDEELLRAKADPRLRKEAILQITPEQIVPLLKDPSLRKASWFGPQRLLARLDPSLELDLLARFGAGTEDRDVDLLLRFVDVGGDVEERHVVAAGFRVVTKAGPTWVVTGPMSGLPKLLESDRINYIEGGSPARTMPR
ncbi:MAG: hypothetical protein H6Q81_1874 [Deltaproteobacteria bacterium]|nr:hypothetical protein [Deltaproteobacteria bacterium]